MYKICLFLSFGPRLLRYMKKKEKKGKKYWQNVLFVISWLEVMVALSISSQPMETNVTPINFHSTQCHPHSSPWKPTQLFFQFFSKFFYHCRQPVNNFVDWYFQLYIVTMETQCNPDINIKYSISCGPLRES